MRKFMGLIFGATILSLNLLAADAPEEKIAAAAPALDKEISQEAHVRIVTTTAYFQLMYEIVKQVNGELRDCSRGSSNAYSAQTNVGAIAILLSNYFQSVATENVVERFNNANWSKLRADALSAAKRVGRQFDRAGDGRKALDAAVSVIVSHFHQQNNNLVPVFTLPARSEVNDGHGPKVTRQNWDKFLVDYQQLKDYQVVLLANWVSYIAELL